MIKTNGMDPVECSAGYMNLAEACIALIVCCRVNLCLAHKASFAFFICYKFIHWQNLEAQLWSRMSSLWSHTEDSWPVIQITRDPAA